MSAFGKNGVRCDACGKIANNRQGEYTRKDGSCGYMWPEAENQQIFADTSRDVCEECIEKEDGPPNVTQRARLTEWGNERRDN